GLKRRSKKISKALDQVLEKIIKEHENNSDIQNGQHHKDFIDILLSLMHQPMDPYDEQSHVIDRNNIKAILIDMVGGAFDTTATVVEWALSALLRHPRTMKNLQDELDKVVGRDKLVEEKDLAKLGYLDIVIKETLRLYPPGPLVPRESIEDAMVDGYFIEKKSRIIINLWAIGRDSKIWSENAEVFYPERFINNNLDFREHDLQFIPFSFGRRGCPGMHLGLIVAKFVVAQLMHCFSWELSGNIAPNDLDMSEKFGLTIPRVNHLLVVPRYQMKDKRRHPPGPPGFPVIGNLHMLGKLPHRRLERLSKKYGGIMSVRLGQVRTIVISSSLGAEQFLKINDAIFTTRPRLEAAKYFSYEWKGLAFAEYGAYWRNMRKMCTLHLLSMSKVQSFAPLRMTVLELAVKSLQKAAMVGQVVDLSNVVHHVVEDIVYKMVVGCSKHSEFDLVGLIQNEINLVASFNLADYVPCLQPFDLQGLKRRFKKVSKAIDEVLEKIIKEHEHNSNVQSERYHKDFIDILLSLMHQPINPYDEQNHVIDKTNIKAILLDMIGGAFETSVIVVEWALSELLRHPRVMKNLQHELDNVVGRNKLVEENDLAKLSYLDIVIKETLRLYPPGPLVPRESTEDAMIQGYFIEKKTRIIINLWAIGRDSKIWSDNAEVFYPERFINNNFDFRGYDFQFIPFGYGRRGCPGIHLGLATVKLVVAQLVHCFSWKLPGLMVPADLDMNEKFGLSMPRAKHLLAMPRCRLLKEACYG
ncbi:hypothetical protein CR513_62579, partial [Mucuna pruriens]